jgi:ABC-2 type transport system ATP-binding protein
VTGIHVENLSKSYRRGRLGGRVRALDGVSMSIAPGEVLGIIGPNGAGKTTFLGCLLGFLTPDSGRVAIDGHEPDALAVRAQTGYLPERLVMDRWMTGRQFLRYHHALARLPEARRADEADAALVRVGLDAEAAGRPIRKYSRGMLQRIGLAQALLGSPRYIFLDEPASGVDPAGVLLFRRLLGELKQQGVTMVLNSHHLDQVERVCDRVAFVRNGRVEAIETVTAGSQHARVVRVRWVTGRSPADEALAGAAQHSGSTLQTHDTIEARFAVADDAGAARLVAALVQSGVEVAELTSEESRLERLFLDPAEAPAAAPASAYMPPGAAGGAA